MDAYLKKKNLLISGPPQLEILGPSLAVVGRSGLGIARSGLASSELGLSKMEGMMSGGGEKKSRE